MQCMYNIDVNVYNTTTRNDNNSWKWIHAYSVHITHIFEIANHPVFNILLVPESKIWKGHYWPNFLIAMQTRWQTSLQWFGVFSLSWLIKENIKDNLHQNR